MESPKEQLKQKTSLSRFLRSPIGWVIILFLLGLVGAVAYYIGIIPEGLIYPGFILLFASLKMTSAEYLEYLQSQKPESGNRVRGHVVAGWVEIGGKRFYARSKFEAAYGYFLQWKKNHGLIKDYEHEPLRFDFPLKRGQNSYLPDYRVTTADDKSFYVEVKGYLDANSKTKLKRMKKYYPEVEVQLVLQHDSASIMQYLPSTWPETSNPTKNV